MPWDLALQSFFNLAISFMNPAGYWKFYPVPVLVEHAHVKEREHEKRVDQTAKSAMYLSSGTAVLWRSDVVPKYLSTTSYLVLAPCAGFHLLDPTPIGGSL